MIVSHVGRSYQRKLKQFSNTKTEISFRLVFIGDTETLRQSSESQMGPGDSWRLLVSRQVVETLTPRLHPLGAEVWSGLVTQLVNFLTNHSHL